MCARRENFDPYLHFRGLESQLTTNIFYLLIFFFFRLYALAAKFLRQEAFLLRNNGLKLLLKMICSIVKNLFKLKNTNRLHRLSGKSLRNNETFRKDHRNK